eukprot:COSAG01_NODE_79243_length_134_cov_9.828571_1_plen_25_part_01
MSTKPTTVTGERARDVVGKSLWFID